MGYIYIMGGKGYLIGQRYLCMVPKSFDCTENFFVLNMLSDIPQKMPRTLMWMGLWSFYLNIDEWITN